MDNADLRELLGDLSWLSPRESPAGEEGPGIAEAIEACIRDYASALSDATARAEAVEQRADEALADLANLAWGLELTVREIEQDLANAGLTGAHRRLRLVCDQMRDALAAREVEFEELTGLPFDDEVIERADVDGWRRNESFDSEVVAETVTPVIRIRKRLYRRARIVAGGPPL